MFTRQGSSGFTLYTELIMSEIGENCIFTTKYPVIFHEIIYLSTLSVVTNLSKYL